MSKFDSGVKYYTYCNLNMNVHFPEDEVKCRWCPFLKHYDNLDRDRCGLTDEIIYTREFMGVNCPLTIINEEKTEEREE